MKNQDIDDLVAEVLADMTAPYPFDIMDRVFVAIETEPTWAGRYHELVRKHDKEMVNERIGRYTKRMTGLRLLGLKRANSSLIKKIALLS